VFFDLARGNSLITFARTTTKAKIATSFLAIMQTVFVAAAAAFRGAPI
jgi:hypothetical protein